MRKYFFDVVGQKSRQYDYSGRLLSTPDEARSHAELVAMDVGMSFLDDWENLHVRCCDPHGAIVHRVDVIYAA